MELQRRFFLLGAVGGILSACTNFDREAGVSIDEGGFGNPTMHNMLVQTGQINLSEIMTRRFAAEVPNMVNFAFDSATLDAQAQTILRQQAHWMQRFPELRYKIYGHTDLAGSAAYNQRLGQRRADAVAHYLVALGVPRGSILAVVSRGQTQPLVVREGREPRNRRTVTEIDGLLRRRPTLMNGEYAAIIHREYVASATQIQPRFSPQQAE